MALCLRVRRMYISSRMELISLNFGVNSVKLPLLLVVSCFLQHLQVYSFTCDVTSLLTTYLCPMMSHQNFSGVALVVFISLGFLGLKLKKQNQ